MEGYDFTHIVLRTKDLRNYHTSVVNEIKEQPPHETRDKIVEILGTMEDELVALETFVEEESKKSALEKAKAKMAELQAQIDALQA